MERKGFDLAGTFDRDAIGLVCTVEGLLGWAVKDGVIGPADKCPGKMNVGHIVVAVTNCELGLADMVEEECNGGNDQDLTDEAWGKEERDYADKAGRCPADPICKW